MTKKRKTATRFRTVTDVDGETFRAKVVRHRGFDGFVVRFTTACSGCSGDCEYSCPSRGEGCAECGYTGKRRQVEWVPFDFAAWDRHQQAVYARLDRLRDYRRKQARSAA